MCRRDKRRARLDREAVEEEERIGLGAFAETPSKRVWSDDEANEDLCLKIVEKSLLLRSANLVLGNEKVIDDNGVVSVERTGIEEGTREEKKSGLRTKKLNKKMVEKKVGKKKKVDKKKEILDQNAFVMEEEDKPEAVEVVAEAAEPNPAEDSGNIVLRKLLRGPRYFDPPDSSWGTCYNCGEEGHTAVNCSLARRRKPCFICGSLEHNVKQCTKGQDCFICKNGEHRAKDCPDKYKSSSIKSKICLKCGGGGHDMFSCRNNYCHDDLKIICCYVCNKMGHLCCAKYVDSCPKEVSCYKCGQLGHTGLSCSRLIWETPDKIRLNGKTTGIESASSCYKCGEGGHFARECTSSSKNGKMIQEPSTPTLKPHRKLKQNKGHKSDPQDLGKGRKKKETQHEGSVVSTPRKLKRRGGWITEDPGDCLFNRNRNSGWKSPATPKGHRISRFTSSGHASTPWSSKRSRRANGTPHFQGQPNGFYHIENGGDYGSRFGYPW